MLALYRSARQADALRAYQLLKSRLGEELGIEPSSGLRKLEEQIVTGDEALETPGAGRRRRASAAEPGLAVRGYELREEIGEGAFGVVYRAYQPAVGREVAIKVIRPELANDADFIRRFQAEAQLVARLEHPHIVPLYDYWREPDAAYLVMRLMRGGSLATVLEQRALSRRADHHDGRSARQRAAGGPPLGRRPPRHQAGQHPHRRRRQRLPVRLRDRRRRRRGLGRSVPSTPTLRTPRPSSSIVASHGGVGHLQPRVVVAQALTGLTVRSSRSAAHCRPRSCAVIDRATDADATAATSSVDAFVTELREALGRHHGPTPARDRRPTTVTVESSRTRTRGCGRSTPPTPSTSSAGNGSSNGSSPGSASRGPAADSSPWSGRAAAASRAS